MKCCWKIVLLIGELTFYQWITSCCNSLYFSVYHAKSVGFASMEGLVWCNAFNWIWKALTLTGIFSSGNYFSLRVPPFKDLIINLSSPFNISTHENVGGSFQWAASKQSVSQRIWALRFKMKQWTCVWQVFHQVTTLNFVYTNQI